MSVPHPLPDDLIELIARRFRVIGEPMRIKLLDLLRDGEATVQELTDATGATQQNVSKHLGVLHDAGVVDRRKDGNRVRYRVADDGVFALCEHVCGSLERQLAALGEIVLGGARLAATSARSAVSAAGPRPTSASCSRRGSSSPPASVRSRRGSSTRSRAPAGRRTAPSPSGRATLSSSGSAGSRAAR
jgi:DNA-binding transcriptional ArsR family regulator